MFSFHFQCWYWWESFSLNYGAWIMVVWLFWSISVSSTQFCMVTLVWVIKAVVTHSLSHQLRDITKALLVCVTMHNMSHQCFRSHKIEILISKNPICFKNVWNLKTLALTLSILFLKSDLTACSMRQHHYAISQQLDLTRTINKKLRWLHDKESMNRVLYSLLKCRIEGEVDQ